LDHPKLVVQNNISRKACKISHNFSSLAHGPIQLKWSFDSLSSKSPKKNGDFGPQTKDYTTNQGLSFKSQQPKW